MCKVISKAATAIIGVFIVAMLLLMAIPLVMIIAYSWMPWLRGNG
jgi:hypothetical protein